MVSNVIKNRKKEIQIIHDFHKVDYYKLDEQKVQVLDDDYTIIDVDSVMLRGSKHSIVCTITPTKISDTGDLAALNWRNPSITFTNLDDGSKPINVKYPDTIITISTNLVYEVSWWADPNTGTIQATLNQKEKRVENSVESFIEPNQYFLRAYNFILTVEYEVEYEEETDIKYPTKIGGSTVIETETFKNFKTGTLTFAPGKTESTKVPLSFIAKDTILSDPVFTVSCMAPEWGGKESMLTINSSQFNRPLSFNKPPITLVGEEYTYRVQVTKNNTFYSIEYWAIKDFQSMDEIKTGTITFNTMTSYDYLAAESMIKTPELQVGDNINLYHEMEAIQETFNDSAIDSLKKGIISTGGSTVVYPLEVLESIYTWHIPSEIKTSSQGVSMETRTTFLEYTTPKINWLLVNDQEIKKIDFTYHLGFEFEINGEVVSISYSYNKSASNGDTIIISENGVYHNKYRWKIEFPLIISFGTQEHPNFETDVATFSWEYDPNIANWGTINIYVLAMEIEEIKCHYNMKEVIVDYSKTYDKYDLIQVDIKKQAKGDTEVYKWGEEIISENGNVLKVKSIAYGTHFTISPTITGFISQDNILNCNGPIKCKKLVCDSIGGL